MRRMDRIRRFALLILAMGIIGGMSGIGAAGESAAPHAVTRIAIVPVTGMIDEVTAAHVRRAVAEARAADAGVLLLEIDTLGGRVDSAQHVCEAVRQFAPRPTIAYVKQNAISAGALIALSCSKIYMAPTATLGDARPVIGAEPSQDEKYVSFVRALFESQAEHNRHNADIARAMVDAEIELVEVVEDGSRELRDAARLSHAGDGSALPVFKPKGKLLVLTARQAEEWSVAGGICDDTAAVLAALGAPGAATTTLDMNGAEQFAKWLVNPILTGLLLSIAMMALWAEFKSPGFGLAGGVAIACFAIVFFGKYVAGLAGTFELVLMLSGIILLILEVAVIPGFGVAGVAGLLCIGLSVLLSLQDFNWPVNPLQENVFERNVILTATVLAVTLAAVLLTLRYAPQLPGLRRLVNAGELSAAAGFTGVVVPPELLNQQGSAETDLRPSGKIRVGSRVIDAVSQGELIARGSRVTVKKVEGNRVVVVPAVG